MNPLMNPVLQILRLWRHRAPLLLAGLLLSLLSLAAGIALLALSGATIAATFAGAALTASLWLRLAGPARILLRYAERLTTHNATFHALADLRIWFFRGLATRAANGLGFHRSGDILSRLVTDVEALDGLYLRIILPLAGALLIVPTVSLFAGRISPAAGLAVCLLFATAAFLLPALAARWARQSGGELAAASSGLRVAALDTLTGLREVRAYDAGPRMAERIAASEASLIAVQRRLAHRNALANAAALLCGQAALLAVLLAAGAAPGLAVATAFLIAAAFDPLSALPRAGVAAGASHAAAARVLEMGRPLPAEPLPTPAPSLPEDPSLRFAGVHFAWGEGHNPVFDGLTLDIQSGAHVAILGPSGSGKSTLAALALKLATPQAGQIMLGGTDLAQLPAATIHRQIARLGQTTHLFDDTIRANLLLGKPDATDCELWDALDRAAIGPMVRTLPDQLDTWLGEGGARLSGGQGRRVALARTLLQHAPILILDEPCAGLDAETEREFLTTLFAEPPTLEKKGRTIILIAHRLTGAERVHRIWRLSSGHAVAAAA